MKRSYPRGRILCANQIGDSIVRYAIEVKRGADIERVAIVDVERQPEGYHQPRAKSALDAVAIERAVFQSIVAKGTKIVASAYNGEVFTGLAQPMGAPPEIEGMA